MNDCWTFNLTSKLWTFIGGSRFGNSLGYHASIGVASAAAYPGGRNFPGMALDYENNKLYLYGGFGFSKLVKGCTFSFGNIHMPVSSHG